MRLPFDTEGYAVKPLIPFTDALLYTSAPIFYPIRISDLC